METVFITKYEGHRRAYALLKLLHGKKCFVIKCLRYRKTIIIKRQINNKNLVEQDHNASISSLSL
jgi:hypothetical protein